MRKILNIGGNDVAFESNAVTPILYKAEFGRDYMAEMLKLSTVVDILENPKKATAEDFDKLDFDVFSRLAWAMAKTADRENTKGYMDWLFEHKDFNVMEHANVIAELVQSNFVIKKK